MKVGDIAICINKMYAAPVENYWIIGYLDLVVIRQIDAKSAYVDFYEASPRSHYLDPDGVALDFKSLRVVSKKEAEEFKKSVEYLLRD